MPKDKLLKKEARLKIEKDSVFVVDEDGKIQQMRYILQFLLPPPPRPPKK